MIKYTTAFVWALASCFFLWFFTYMYSWTTDLGASQELLGLGELFSSFVMFTLVVTLGGASYYIMSKLIDANYDHKDRSSWLRLVIYLQSALACEFLVLIALIYMRDTYRGLFDIEIFMAIFTILWVMAMFMMRLAVHKMRDMRVLAGATDMKS